MIRGGTSAGKIYGIVDDMEALYVALGHHESTKVVSNLA